MSDLAMPINTAATMDSIELLDLVNAARAEFSEPQVRRNDFTARCLDELKGDHYETFVVHNGNGTQSEAVRMTRDQCMYVLMRESKAVRRRVVSRLNAGSAQIPAALPTKVVGELAILECFTRMLRPAPSSQIAMLSGIAKQNGLDDAFLPAYAIDAASDANDGSSMPTAPLTDLLREHNIGYTAKAYNQLLRDTGMLEERTRRSGKPGSAQVRKFWAVTDAGLSFGKNLTSPSSPRETQPHWYAVRFMDLHGLVLARLKGGAA